MDMGINCQWQFILQDSIKSFHPHQSLSSFFYGRECYILIATYGGDLDEQMGSARYRISIE
jgi:hypothetical protein